MMLVQSIKTISDKFSSSEIARRMMSGTFWSLTGTAIAKFVVLVAGILCARILSKEQYGEFGIVRSTINMFVVVGSAGLGAIATKYISEYIRVDKGKIASIYLLTNGFAYVTGLVVSLTIILLAPLLANNTLNCSELLVPIRLGAVLLFVTVINSAQNGTLMGFESFKSISINTLLGSVVESCGMVVGAYFYGVSGAILGFGLGYFTLFFCNRFSIKRNLKENDICVSVGSFDKKDISLLYSFGLPTMLSSLMVTPTYWVLRTLIVNKSGFDELAAYEAAEQWRNIIIFIPAAVGNIALPILSSLSNSAKSKFWKVLKVSLMLNASVALLLSIIVVLFSPLIMNLYGKDYVSNTMTLNILCLSCVFQAMANVVGISISSRAKVWWGLCFNVCWAVLLIILTYVLLTLGLGSAGASIAVLVSYAVHTSAQIIYLFKTMRADEQ